MKKGPKTLFINKPQVVLGKEANVGKMIWKSLVRIYKGIYIGEYMEKDNDCSLFDLMDVAVV